MRLEDGKRLREDDIAILIPKELYNRFEQIAARKGMKSTPDLIRMILWDYPEDTAQ